MRATRISSHSTPLTRSRGTRPCRSRNLQRPPNITMIRYPYQNQLLCQIVLAAALAESAHSAAAQEPAAITNDSPKLHPLSCIECALEVGRARYLTLIQKIP